MWYLTRIQYLEFHGYVKVSLNSITVSLGTSILSQILEYRSSNIFFILGPLVFKITRFENIMLIIKLLFLNTRVQTLVEAPVSPTVT